MFEVTKKFVGGTLAGITITERTTVQFPVGLIVAKPVGGSPYEILACVKVAA